MLRGISKTYQVAWHFTHFSPQQLVICPVLVQVQVLSYGKIAYSCLIASCRWLEKFALRLVWTRHSIVANPSQSFFNLLQLSHYIFKQEQNKPQQVIHVTPHNPSSAVKNHQNWELLYKAFNQTAFLYSPAFNTDFHFRVWVFRALIRMAEQKVLVRTYVMYVCISLRERERERERDCVCEEFLWISLQENLKSCQSWFFPHKVWNKHKKWCTWYCVILFLHTGGIREQTRHSINRHVLLAANKIMIYLRQSLGWACGRFAGIYCACVSQCLTVEGGTSVCVCLKMDVSLWKVAVPKVPSACWIS